MAADGVYNEQALVNRINSDLANDLGNLVSRTITMIERYFDGQIPKMAGALTDADKQLRELAAKLPDKVEAFMNALSFSDALSGIFELVSFCNKYIDITRALEPCQG